MSLDIIDVYKTFPTTVGEIKALDGVSLIIPANTVLGLVGESGSGKSTLGKVITGLEHKSGGNIRWQGEAMPKRFGQKNFARYSADIQMIFQDPYSALNPRMNVAEIIEEPLHLSAHEKFKDLNKNARKDLVDTWLDNVGLRSEIRSRYPHEFSGGQRQRIGIARALITQPRLLICDEPISALDVSIQAQIINLLKDLQQNLGMSMLFIAHDLAMVNYISDEIAVMYLGKIVEHGSAEKIFSEPKHPYTQLLVASNLSAEPRSELHQAPSLDRVADDIVQGEIPSSINLPKGCRFAGRCPYVGDRCLLEEPKLKFVDSEQRKIACFNFDG